MKKILMLPIMLISSIVSAAEYRPTEPISVIVPYREFSAGAKVFQILQKYAAAKNVTLTPVWRPGADGMIGLNYAGSGTIKPDTSVLLTATSDTVVEHTAKKVSNKHFIPVTAIARPKVYVVGHPDVPANNLSELVDIMRKDPGRLSWSVGNRQFYNDLELVTKDLKIDMSQMVITRSNGTNSVPLVVGKHIDLGMWPGTVVSELVKGGQLKIIGSYKKGDKPNNQIQSIEEMVGMGTLTDDGVGLFLLPNSSKNFVEFWKKFCQEFHQDESVKQQLADNYFYKFDNGEEAIVRILKTHSKSTVLTQREEEIYNLIRVRGLSNRQISTQLSIGESAVKLHVSNLLKKHGLRSRTQLAALPIN